MTPAQYTSMVEMLIKATQSEKLIWEDKSYELEANKEFNMNI